jgi:hypothetical protein
VRPEAGERLRDPLVRPNQVAEQGLGHGRHRPASRCLRDRRS